MQGLTQPTLLLKPFADSGDKNSIPVTNSDISNPQLADLTNGFPVVTGKKPEDGGLPPERKDFNGLGYLTTTYDYFYQAGGTFTYNATIASAIGGYPLGARLWYTDGNGATVILRSNKANNSDNFITTPSYIGTSWVQETPALSWNNTWTGSNTFSGSIISSANNTFTGKNTFTQSIYVKNTGNRVVESFGSDNNVCGTFESWDDGNSNKTAIYVFDESGTNGAMFGVNYNNGNPEANASSGVKASMVGWAMPKYTSRTSYTKNSAVSSNGYVFISLRPSSDEQTWTISVNGKDIYHIKQRYRSKDPYIIPVQKGDKVNWSGSFDSNPELYFVPCVGG